MWSAVFVMIYSANMYLISAIAVYALCTLIRSAFSHTCT